MPRNQSIYVVADIHGSELCWRKFLNAAKFYGVDTMVVAGDVTGKAVVPVVERRDGRVEANIGGRVQAARKAGLIGLTKALARELAPDVRVNAVAPGVIDTPQLAVDAAAAGITLDEIRERYAASAPLRRIASAREIAASVVFLASPEAAYYTGQVLQPNGGSTLA